ncbi:MAG: cellulase family glycosylhydrolase [Gammaproteobacteria bacterium]
MSMKLLAVAAVSLGMTQVGFSADFTNKIIGVGPKTSTVGSPIFCIQNADGKVVYELGPNTTIKDVAKYTGNPYYVGGALRFGGCNADNTYLGYMGLSVSERKIAFSPLQGSHMTYTDPLIDNNGNITGKIQYVPIKAKRDLLSKKEPSVNQDWDFVGINLSGLEFGKMIDPLVVPNLSDEEASGTRSDLAETQAFLKSGMNTIRVPVSWGYLQLDGPGKGNLNNEYFDSFVAPLLESLTSAHVYAMVDLHAYMRYSEFGKEYSGCGMDGKCPDGTLILEASAYQDVWTKLYEKIKNDPNINMNYIMFDLVNEPVDVPDDLVFTIQAKVITSLRNAGYQGYILVEGNSWSGLHSWTNASWKSRDGKSTYTNASLFTRENFAKAGIADLSKVIINAHQYLDSDYSGTHEQCLTDLKTTGANGFNLAAFSDYLQQNKLKAIVTEFGGGRDSASCQPAMMAFLNYMKDNSAKNKEYGFVGWTAWSAGHGWGNYNLRVTPSSYQMQVMQNYLQKMSE